MLLKPTIRVTVDPGDGNEDREVFWFADESQQISVATGYFDPDHPDRDYVIFDPGDPGDPGDLGQSGRFEGEQALILRPLGRDGGTVSNSASSDDEEGDVDYVDDDA